MNIKELKEIIKDLPEDYEVMLEYKDYSNSISGCPAIREMFSEYVQKPCTARVYTQKTLMITEI